MRASWAGVGVGARLVRERREVADRARKLGRGVERNRPRAEERKRRQPGLSRGSWAGLFSGLGFRFGVLVLFSFTPSNLFQQQTNKV